MINLKEKLKDSFLSKEHQEECVKELSPKNHKHDYMENDDLVKYFHLKKGLEYYITNPDEVNE